MQTETHNAPKKSGAWLFILGLAVIGLFLLAANFYRGGKTSTTDPEDPARDAERVKNLADLRADDDKKLNTYAWVDQAKGSVQIPVNQAMNLAVGKLNAVKPAPAYPVLDNTGQPVPPSKLPTPQELDAADELPKGQAGDGATNALTAPVGGPDAKTGKAQKSQTQQ